MEKNNSKPNLLPNEDICDMVDKLQMQENNAYLNSEEFKVFYSQISKIYRAIELNILNMKKIMLESKSNDKVRRLSPFKERLIDLYIRYKEVKVRFSEFNYFGILNLTIELNKTDKVNMQALISVLDNYTYFLNVYEESVNLLKRMRTFGKVIKIARC